jgi:rubredoxin
LVIIYQKEERNFTMKYVCDVCGWVFDEKICDPDHGINVGMTFEELPEDFECPLCGVGKDQFSPAE